QSIFPALNVLILWSILIPWQNFHPAPIEQVWLRNGLPLNTTSLHKNITTNADGSFSLDTYLSLQSERTEDVSYSCWVNHSSLIINDKDLLSMFPKTLKISSEKLQDNSS
uniref:Ig-like domain-containing protein n=1 Tax=Scleropages formosus TaxID=113540 RepID=A0A8C9RP58_SCLFO